MSTTATPPTASSGPQSGEAPAIGRGLPRPVQRFLDTAASGGILLVVAAVVALVWANSPAADGYDRLWASPVDLRIGTFGFTDDLRHLVNDGLMALFFFVVGLEIKRELVAGELRDPRTAALPIIAAVGGMAVPAALFAVFNAGQPGGAGWGIPMATDIAFALGVVALLGRRVPPALKLFLLTLAIVDDIGAILGIAVFYSAGIDGRALAVAAALVGATVLLRRADVQSIAPYVVLGVGVWLAVHESGVHATIAGVALGLLTPAHPRSPADVAREWTDDLLTEPSPADIETVRRLAGASVSMAETLQHRLHPLTSYLIVPLFALANAGVRIQSDALEPDGAGRVALGVVVGLVVGKLVGVSAATWLAVRTGLGSLPAGTSWRQVFGAGALAGIGFTVSIFVTGLAFDAEDAGLESAAKLAVVVASVLAAALGTALLVGGKAGGPAAEAPSRSQNTR
ncbi:MAG: Na+/H+ antiporter NhaA [Acidimicrobiia bacterium]|nr:Na+/H+ antiporter NhaA [Acidimicrobiia bacterium]